MKTKTCTKCKQDKLLKEFSPAKQNNDSLSSWCRKCHNKATKERRNKYPWKQTLINIKQRCSNPKSIDYKDYGGRGIKCLITEDELKKLWFRDKAYEMEHPSIDRKENNSNYTFDNCEFIEMNINSGKDKPKPINQYNLQGNFIKTWKSGLDIENTLNFSRSHISQVCSGKRKKANGFIWKFKVNENV